MKKKTTIDKKHLVLNKEQVRLLSDEKLREAVGGRNSTTTSISGSPYCTIP